MAEINSNLYYTNARVYANVSERLLNLDSNIIPAQNEVYNLGSPTRKFKDLYLSGFTINLGNTVLSSGQNGALSLDSLIANNVTSNTWVNLYTANVIESASNLYFTNARVYANIAPLLTTANILEVGSNIYYTNTRVYSNVVSLLPTYAGNITAGNIITGGGAGGSITGANLISANTISATNWIGIYTANIVESTGNLYYTNARVYANIAPLLTTANILEVGSNIYYTNARVYANVIGLLNAKANVTDLTTANIVESTGNLYFTNARTIGAITNQDITLSNLTLLGDLIVQGNTVTLNTATVIIEDKNILLANGATSSAMADGAGISIAGADANIKYVQSTNSFNLNKNLIISGNILPDLANYYDIGSADKPFRDLWLYGSSIKFSNSSTTISSTANTFSVTQGTNVLISSNSGTTIITANNFVVVDGSNTVIFVANATNKPITSPTGTITANLLQGVVGYTTSNIAEGANLYFTNTRAIAALQPSIAELRALASSFSSNVLYVAGNGNDANDGRSFGNAFANIHVALAAATPWTTVFVKSGDYRLYNQPVTIPRRVALVGDNLRTTTIRPSQPTVDMFYVNNACYVTGITFRDHQSPSAVFSFNPNGSAGTIVTSPYIQNCSSITTTGTGMRVDGSYVSGLRSMVCDAYTQTNEGGIGIHMLNQGYTQLVSVFTICCHIAILCETGGFCSVTNSNASFGTYGLVADGVSDPLYYGTVQTGNPEATNQLTLSNLSIKPNYGDFVLFANYNQDKCSRDTGLIVDSLAFDLAYNGNSQSTFAGLQYWSQTESAIPNQSVETLAAIAYARSLATNVVANIVITSPYQGSNVQQFASSPSLIADLTSNTKIAAEFDLISNIIINGTTGVTDLIIPNSYPANTNAYVNHAANLLNRNNVFIASEVVAFVNTTYPGFTYNSSTCFRDVGYIIASIQFDLLHGGNKQAVQSGTYYYQYNANLTQINNQVVQTSAAYNFIGTLIGNIVTATAVAKGYNSAKCERDTGLIVDSIALDLLYSGNSQANFAGLQYWSQTASAIPNQSEETLSAITFVKNISSNIILGTYSGDYQNNVNYIAGTTATASEASLLTNKIDLVSNIITNGTVGVTDQIIPNGLYANTNTILNYAANIVITNKSFIAAETIAYVNQTYPGFFANALNFIDAANAQATCSRDVGYIIDSVVFDMLHDGNKQSIQAGTYYYQYSSNVTQINNQIVKTGQAYTFIAGLVDKIVSNTIITPLYQTTIAQNTNAAVAATIAERNKTIQTVRLINSIIANGPNAAIAKTPINLTVSTDANVRNAANAIIANRDFIKAETIAYVDLELFDPPYQIAVKQNTTAAPAATYAEANIILNSIGLISNIISTGPSVAPAKIPIGLTANTNPNVINATKLILANRDYIKAEVLEYVNRSWANISNGSGTFYTVQSATTLSGNISTVTFLETVTDIIRTNTRVSFHQGSYISSSGHTFEYVGSGDTIATALPYLGGVPIQENEVVESRGGKVYFTSTDQLGDFRIGTGLVINRVDGTITGRTFNKALFAVMTPYMLAIEG